MKERGFSFDGMYCPFLYSTNGEVLWFHDVRHPMNRSRRIAGFHTARALEELLGRDFEADCEHLLTLPHDHPKLRPYQKDANAAVEPAIGERKRNLLVAMATGTGKTFTLVNEEKFDPKILPQSCPRGRLRSNLHQLGGGRRSYRRRQGRHHAGHYNIGSAREPPCAATAAR